MDPQKQNPYGAPQQQPYMYTQQPPQPQQPAYGAYYGQQQPPTGYQPQVPGQYNQSAYNQPVYGNMPPPQQYNAYQAPAGVQAPPTENNDESVSLLQRNDPNSIWSAKFNDRDIRMNFVRKVYAILGVQLLITSCCVLIPMYNQAMFEFMVRPGPGVGVLIGAIIGQIFTSCALICCRSLSRTVPINYIMVAFIAAHYAPHVHRLHRLSLDPHLLPHRRHWLQDGPHDPCWLCSDNLLVLPAV
ncbi:hypothetical protein FGO68_gene2603 [Halteria grandinella]|uniref:Uncharacterized protein n=1 Tax=Halteria grandinella TaxID=5974 RepID=A0A8J8NCI0_HALGN|nr:hypothetical protein FGO68_gene2603 [Halteria grandinella]